MSDSTVTIVETPVPQRSLARAILSFCIPLIIMGVGFGTWQLIPRFFPQTANLDIWPWAVVQILLVVAWLLIELKYMAKRDTSGTQLQRELTADIFLGLVLTAILFCLIGGGNLTWGLWWYLAPYAGVVADLFLSANMGINNALQKPGLQNPSQ